MTNMKRTCPKPNGEEDEGSIFIYRPMHFGPSKVYSSFFGFVAAFAALAFGFCPFSCLVLLLLVFRLLLLLPAFFFLPSFPRPFHLPPLQRGPAVHSVERGPAVHSVARLLPGSLPGDCPPALVSHQKLSSAQWFHSGRRSGPCAPSVRFFSILSSTIGSAWHSSTCFAMRTSHAMRHPICLSAGEPRSKCRSKMAMENIKWVQSNHARHKIQAKTPAKKKRVKSISPWQCSFFQFLHQIVLFGLSGQRPNPPTWFAQQKAPPAEAQSCISGDPLWTDCFPVTVVFGTAASNFFVFPTFFWTFQLFQPSGPLRDLLPSEGSTLTTTGTSAALLSSSSQQFFPAAFLSSFSQQPFSAAILSYHLAVVRGWWSALNIILLWSGLGGQLSSFSQQPFSAAFLSSHPELSSCCGQGLVVSS